jgi:hypothetical protein
MYAWEESYRAAAFENDRSKLPERIQAALTVINRRVRELNEGKGSASERSAIREALDVLIILRVEATTPNVRLYSREGLHERTSC